MMNSTMMNDIEAAANEYLDDDGFPDVDEGADQANETIGSGVVKDNTPKEEDKGGNRTRKPTFTCDTANEEPASPHPSLTHPRIPTPPTTTSTPRARCQG